MQKVTYILGDSNSSPISSGTNTKAVSCIHQAGNDMIITGFQINYASGKEKCFARIYDAQRNRDITSPRCPLTSIGVSDADSATIAPWINIEPIVLKSGQSIDLYIQNNTGGTINADEIRLTLYGYQAI